MFCAVLVDANSVCGFLHFCDRFFLLYFLFEFFFLRLINFAFVVFSVEQCAFTARH
jgi:hypothetical protein